VNRPLFGLESSMKATSRAGRSRACGNVLARDKETAMSAHIDAPGGESGAVVNGGALGADDRLEILKLQALWTAVTRAGRPERAAELCAQDVVVLPPDAAPITGRDAARTWLKGLNGGPIERIEVEGTDLRGGPQSAWLTSTVTTTRRRSDGAASRERERRLWALTKDGPVWRVRLAGWEPAGSASPGSSEDVQINGHAVENGAGRSDAGAEPGPRDPWRGLLRRPI
jgi:ketosteroid isomerase-like protein